MNTPTKETLLHRGYWKAAVGELHDTRKLVFAALMVAMAIALGFLPSLHLLGRRFSISFLARALCAYVVGPYMGLLYGFVEDILGYMVNPKGAFFIGYTISTMAGMFVYSVCFYRRRMSVLRIMAANLFVNVFVNAFLGTMWEVIQKTENDWSQYWGWFFPAIVKNAGTFLPKVICLYIMFQAALPILGRIGIIQKRDDYMIRPW